MLKQYSLLISLKKQIKNPDSDKKSLMDSINDSVYLMPFS